MIKISHPTGKLHGQIDLPKSKSIFNRMLMLKYLYFHSLPIHGSADSNDVVVLERLLKASSDQQGGTTLELNAEDAGTVFRFMLAYCCFKGGSYSVTGFKRLLERPTSPLIKSLQDIGFNISDNSGSININSAGLRQIQNFDWIVDVSLSSQFASALVLHAPLAPQEVTIHLKGKPVSLAYLDLTIAVMNQYGMRVHRNNMTIKAHPFEVIPHPCEPMEIERDWSSASYFVAMASLSESSEIDCNGLKLQSLQPDVAISQLAQMFRVDLISSESSVKICSNQPLPLVSHVARDYSDCPDIAMTEMVVYNVLNVKAVISGVQHLQHKESNRLASIQKALKIFQQTGADQTCIFETYHDHRVAMSLAPLAVIRPIIIKNPEVVVKSFPEFWKQLIRLGFKIEELNAT